MCALLQLIAFTEVGIMHRLRNIPGVCKLHDYGIDQEHIYLVMTKHSCCLRDWREKQKSDPSQQLKLYLNIFCQLVELVQVWQITVDDYKAPSPKVIAWEVQNPASLLC